MPSSCQETCAQEWSAIQLSTASDYPDLSWENAGPELSFCCNPTTQRVTMSVTEEAPMTQSEFAKAVAQQEACRTASIGECDRQNSKTSHVSAEALGKLDRA